MTKEPPEIPNIFHLIDQMGNHNHRRHAAPAEPTMRETLAEARDAARGLTPYGYLMSIMRDNDADPYLRVMAAEALMPYCHKTE